MGERTAWITTQSGGSMLFAEVNEGYPPDFGDPEVMLGELATRYAAGDVQALQCGRRGNPLELIGQPVTIFSEDKARRWVYVVAEWDPGQRCFLLRWPD